MTTNGGSIWDRGPSDGDDDVPAPEPDVTGDAGGTEAESEPGDGDLGTVWSRGPSIREALDSPDPVRVVPEPVLPPRKPPIAPRRRVLRRRPVALLTLVAVAVLVGGLAWSLDIVGGEQAGEQVVAGPTTVLSVPSGPTAAPASTEPITTEPATTAPITAEPATTETARVEPAVTQPSTTTSTTTTTTTSTTTTTTTSTTTTLPPVEGPQVAIVGRIGPCNFGDDCLIADFSVSGFETTPSEFVCEFANGSRYTFRFDGAGADDACATSSPTGTITIEIGGVRSETITR